MTGRIRSIAAALLLHLAAGSALRAQSVAELQAHYSGSTRWEAATRTLTFTGSGAIGFDKRDHKNAYWDVPVGVVRILVEADVTVTGAFHTHADCVIEGRDRHRSVIFGTPERSWANHRDLKAYRYAQIENQGGTLTVRCLTLRNPFSYFVRGYGSTRVCHVRQLDLIDDRGGWGNHSDGFVGGDGSTMDDCYLETGDDAIKAYFDMAVTNTTIRMVQNCVPIQIGWHRHGTVTLNCENLTILGSQGRGRDRGIIASHGSAGNTHLTLCIRGCAIETPEASLFDLENRGDVVQGTVTDARIRVGRYLADADGRVSVSICGTTAPRTTFDCGGRGFAPTFPRDLRAERVGPTAVTLHWRDVSLVEDAVEVQRAEAGTAVWLDAAVLAADSTTYTDTTLQRHHRYTYRLRARNRRGASDWSQAVTVAAETTAGDPRP